MRFSSPQLLFASLLAAIFANPCFIHAQVSYQPILGVDYSVTGVRGIMITVTNQDIVYTGNGPGGQGLLYVGNLFGGGATNILNAFGGVGTTNTLLYGPDTPAFNPSIGIGNIRAVGTYKQ